jgi:hypothetical protein
MKYIYIVLLASILILSGCTGTATDGTLQIKAKELPQWISGGTATFKPEVTGGKPPYNFSIGDGTSLPTGFNMGPDGTIGGGGTLAPGSSKSISQPFMFVVTDSAGKTAKISYTIVITEPPIGIFPQEVTCTVNQKCNEAIATATRGNPPYTFQSDTFREGAPPPGTIIDVNGRLTGIPTQTGEYTVGVCVKDTVANSKCGHATVIITEENNEKINGTWIGSYSEKETSEACICTNTGTLTLSLKVSGDSFGGTAEDDGATISSTCGDAETGSYTLSGTFTGTISGGSITGTMVLSGDGGTANLPVQGTITDDTITATYTGTGTYSDGSSSTFVGSFTLKRQ